MVQVRTLPAFNARYAISSGNVSDDLGSTVNNITSGDGILGGVVGGLLQTTPIVAGDPSPTAPKPNDVTGLRCGVADLQNGLCVSGTLGAASVVPVVKSLVTGGQFENLPSATATSASGISQLREQARATSTYTATPVAGAASSSNPPACAIPAGAGPDTVVFLEQVGTGDQYCKLDVATTRTYRALVVGSGRIVVRGNGSATKPYTGSVVNPVNVYHGFIYALNLQRNFNGDSSAREVIRLDGGAHVVGGIAADGKSGQVAIVPPPLNAINTTALVNALCPAGLAGATCRLLATLTSGLDSILNGLVTALGAGGPTKVVTGLLDQLSGQAAAYGSPVTADTTAVSAVRLFGPSSVLAGSFKDLGANR